jgi:hypothetical protein
MRANLGKRSDEVEIQRATRGERGKRRAQGQKGRDRVPKPKRG